MPEVGWRVCQAAEIASARAPRWERPWHTYGMERRRVQLPCSQQAGEWSGEFGRELGHGQHQSHRPKEVFGTYSKSNGKPLRLLGNAVP